MPKVPLQHKSGRPRRLAKQQFRIRMRLAQLREELAHAVKIGAAEAMPRPSGRHQSWFLTNAAVQARLGSRFRNGDGDGDGDGLGVDIQPDMDYGFGHGVFELSFIS